MPVTTPNIRAIFDRALEIASESERSAYLDEACAGAPEIRQQVEALLAAHAAAGSFLEVPPSAVVANSGPTLDLAPQERPGTPIGPYKLIEQIGEGGMGTVWMAQQSEPVKRVVALKLIKAGMDSQQVIARFEAERQALALMDHANIARVLDAGTTDAGRPYFVMDLVRGVPITRYCDEHHLTPRQRLELFIPVCQAIQHAHQKGIIHRDLKPSNVLVALYDGRPVPKVIDFGVAKATGQSLTDKTLVTGFGNIVGTLEYMSPEQAEVNQLDIDTRSDIYSLGVLLYELLTGGPPFSRKDLEKAGMLEMLRVIREEEPSKPSTKLSSSDALPTLSANRGTEPATLTKLVRGELDWIVMKSLEKDRSRRYETANGFAMDVQRYLADEAVEACPPSVRYRLRKFARRNKVALAVSALVLFFLVLSGIGIGWSVRDRAAREAEFVRERAMKQSALEQEVNLALKEAERWQEQEKWQEALSAAKRAEGLLAGSGSDEFRERLRRLRKDLEMILRLDEIRPLSSEWKDTTFDWEGADRAYTQAFADYGIDVLKLSVDEAAARIHERAAVAVPMAVALDDWARVRAKDRPALTTLTAVAQAADPDPWRRQVRQAVQQKDTKALAALAASPDLLRQPATSLLFLSITLGALGLKEAEIAVLRQAQRLYPGDFWINYGLALKLANLGSPHLDDAVSFYRAALAVRPQSSVTHNAIGDVLRKQGKLDEAIACNKKAIELAPTYPGAYCSLGFILLDQGKPDEALARFNKAIELAPKSAWLHCSLGLALMRLGKPDEAIACYRKAIELDSKYAFAHHMLGNALKDQKKLDEAIVCYDTAIRLTPDNPVPWSGRGSAHLALRQYDKALADYTKAIELKPDYAEAWGGRGSVYLALRQYEKAIVDKSKAVELKPHDASMWYSRGVAYKEFKQYDQAIADYSKAIELKPDDAAAWNNRGVIYRDLKQYDKAIADSSKAIELKPDFERAWQWRHRVYIDLKQYDRAIADYSKAIELKPDYAEAWSYRNRIYETLKQVESAVAEYSKVIDRNPHNAVAWHYRGVAYASLEQYDKAIADFAKAIELRPDYALAWRVRHGVYARQKQYDRAIAEYSKAIDRKPDNAWAWHSRGLAHHVLKQHDKAFADFSKAIELQPDYAEAWQARHGVYGALKQHDQAIADYSKVIDVKPDTAQAWYHRGLAHASLEQWEKAIVDYSRAIALKPDDIAAVSARGRAYARLKQWDKVIADRTTAMELRPSSLEIDILAMLLADCPDPKFRDPARAVELAKQSVEIDPAIGGAWNTLGLAHYRAGDWPAASNALHKAMELSEGGTSHDWFLLAMTYWRLGDKPEARKWYDKAVEWMDEKQPTNKGLRDYRAEAEELMGIGGTVEVAPPPAGEEVNQSRRTR